MRSMAFLAPRSNVFCSVRIPKHIGRRRGKGKSNVKCELFASAQQENYPELREVALMLHIEKHPDWLLKEILTLYPAWRDRTPETTPYHLYGYSSGCVPLSWTGDPYPGWRSLPSADRLLHDDVAMEKPEALRPENEMPAIWHTVWRLWERSLPPGWTRETEEIAPSLWCATGRCVTPAEMGVPVELHYLCALTAEDAQKKIKQTDAA